MKIPPVVAELFLAEGQTNMTKLTVAFRNFAIAPNNVRIVVPVPHTACCASTHGLMQACQIHGLL